MLIRWKFIPIKTRLQRWNEDFKPENGTQQTRSVPYPSDRGDRIKIWGGERGVSEVKEKK